jgi:hypothetical protein
MQFQWLHFLLSFFLPQYAMARGLWVLNYAGEMATHHRKQLDTYGPDWRVYGDPEVFGFSWLETFSAWSKNGINIRYSSLSLSCA